MTSTSFDTLKKTQKKNKGARRCPICDHFSYITEVKVIVGTTLMGTFNLYRDAESFVLDSKIPTAIVRHVYRCTRCGYEEDVVERLVKGIS